MDEDIEWMGYQAIRLARTILASVPERPIWENAIEKADKNWGADADMETTARIESEVVKMMAVDQV